MDIIYLVSAGALWATVLGLALACERLQSRKVTP
jgi:hypothetical protein